MPAWRADLPPSWKAGTLTVTPRAASSVFEPEFNIPMARRRTSTVVWDYSGRVDLTGAQAASLAEMYAVDCAGGALSFTRHDAYSGALATFRFVSPPSVQHVALDAFYADLELLRIA